MTTVIYDKAKYHFKDANPETKQPYVHTGMFLGWIIEHNLYSKSFLEDFKQEVEFFKSKKKTGTEIYQACDGVLSNDMLNKKGNDFAQYYFDFDKGNYIKDYIKIFNAKDPNFFKVEDVWENYEKLKNIIDIRYEEFLKLKI